MELVEVVARIGDTVLEVEHVRPGEPYRIGTFPVFDGKVVHVPAGLVARVDGRRNPGPTIELAGTIELQVGLVMLTIQKTTRERQRVPRPRRELRPYLYLAASLIVQLAIWFAAVSLAPFHKLVRPVHRIAHITHVHEPPPPPPAKPSRSAASGSMHGPAERTKTAPAYKSPGQAMAHLAKTIGEIHIAEKVAASNGPTDPNAAFDEQNFGGGGHRFNVDDVAPEKTYAVTKWALPTYFHQKGELAPIPSITLCDDDSCSVEGPRDMHAILAQLIAHEAEIAMCYREHTGDLAGQIRIRFEISPQGKVTGEYGKPDGPVGYGTGTVGRCVAKIAARLRWGQAPDQARVFIGMAFRPV
jgi:hypothetical protein